MNYTVTMLLIVGVPILFAVAFYFVFRRSFRRDVPKITRPWQIVAKDASYPLGILTYEDALMKAAKLGRVGYVDFDYGIIFINLPGHSGEAPPDASGISQL